MSDFEHLRNNAERRMAQRTVASLMNPKRDMERCRRTLAAVCSDDGDVARAILHHVLSAAAKGGAESAYHAKLQQLNEIIDALKEGPVRMGTFVERRPPEPDSGVIRAAVILENGDSILPVVADNTLGESLRCGDAVWLDSQARTVLFRAEADTMTGEIATFKSRIAADRAEVTLHHHEEEVFRLADVLRDQIDRDEVQPGARLLVCSRRRMAFCAVTPIHGDAHLRFVDPGPVPDVVIKRDIGCPPAYIQDLLEHIRAEMTAPEHSRRYGLRRMQTRLLAGVSGSGKSLSINGFIRATYELISEVTGAPLDQIPKRVLRVRPSNVLNMWLGESDKNWDRSFDEADQLANETFCWNGRRWPLPVISVHEEIDGLARARGTSDATYDRIQTTALERLDHLSRNLGDKLIIFLFTTNILHECDVAFIRRAGGEIIEFGMLDKRQFEAILAKQLRGRPLCLPGRAKEDERVSRICNDVTNWIFSGNGHDPGQLELTFAGAASTAVKYRRDLLTAAIVDRSVQQAAKEACQLERVGCETPGISRRMILSALADQIQATCRQVTPYNVHNYLTLPDGARVASVRRIEQPGLASFELDSD